MRTTLLLVSMACAVLAGCDGTAPVADDALRNDMERLENEIGKLEFRVFQLEQALLATSDNNSDREAVPDAALPPSAPATANPAPARGQTGRYDLTPVE